MSDDKQKTDLQASYNAMVEAVEEFVVKEGKSLQRGLDAIEGVSHAYKEHLLFEWDYINNALWEKFQSIANSNTTELIAFTKTLKEQAEAATTDSHISAHQQHSEWDSEHAFWLDEIKLWKKNHKEALSKLHEIEQAIKSHSTILNEHSQAINKHMKLEHQHEEQMKYVEQDPSNEQYKSADENKMAQHKHEQINHAHQAKLHEKLKAKHLQTMVMVNMLHTEVHKK